MLWLGLTGGIACGKSTVASLLTQQGFPVVDADHISHAVTGPESAGLLAVNKAFGPGVLRDDGSLERKKLGDLVFADPTALQRLEKILHPLIQAQVLLLKSEIAKTGAACAVYDVPLLFEKNLQSQFDGIIVVTATPEVQKQRLMARQKLTSAEADLRLSAQLPLAQKVRGATWVIENSGDHQALQTAVADLAHQIQIRISKK